DMPMRLWIFPAQSIELRRQGGGGDGFREHAQSRTLGLPQPSGPLEQLGAKCLPTRHIFPVHHGLRAVRVPKLQYRGLCEDVRAAEARGMLRIALNLRGAAHVVFDEHAMRVAVADQRGREESG